MISCYLEAWLKKKRKYSFKRFHTNSGLHWGRQQIPFHWFWLTFPASWSKELSLSACFSQHSTAERPRGYKAPPRVSPNGWFLLFLEHSPQPQILICWQRRPVEPHPVIVWWPSTSGLGAHPVTLSHPTSSKVAGSGRRIGAHSKPEWKGVI